MINVNKSIFLTFYLLLSSFLSINSINLFFGKKGLFEKDINHLEEVIDKKLKLLQENEKNLKKFFEENPNFLKNTIKAELFLLSANMDKALQKNIKKAASELKELSKESVKRIHTAILSSGLKLILSSLIALSTYKYINIKLSNPPDFCYKKFFSALTLGFCGITGTIFLPFEKNIKKMIIKKKKISEKIKLPTLEELKALKEKNIKTLENKKAEERKKIIENLQNPSKLKSTKDRPKRKMSM